MTPAKEKYKEIHNHLTTDGYYVGTFDDFYNDITGVSKDHLEVHSRSFIESANYRDESYVYRHNYIDQHSKTYTRRNNFSGPYANEEDVLEEIPITSAQKRKDFIQSLINAGVETRTTQQWGRLDLGSFDGRNEELRIKIRKMEDFFKELFITHSSEIYSGIKPEQCDTASQFSLYEDGDFSEVHYDGINPNRFCVIIVYFSDPLTYNKSCGGELYIETPSGQVIEVNPTYGNYAMLDFTKFNLGHGIRAVGNGYKRFTLQCFVGTKNE
jgi:Rps23 Pro-64 3,4-dihydroxylase Tpa1-like proline 4-hydroxylase